MKKKGLKQKSLFDLPAGDQGEPTTGEAAKGEGLEVVVNDYSIDAGEPIRFAAIETKVGDDTVLIEVIPPRVDTYRVTIEGLGRRKESKLMDVVTVAKVTIISDGEVFEHYLVRQPVTARYAYQLTDDATKLE